MIDEQELLKKHKITANDFNNNEIGCFLELDASKSRLDGLFTPQELRRIADAMEEWTKDNEKSFYHILGEDI